MLFRSEQAKTFAEQYIGNPEFAQIKIDNSLRLKVFLIHSLLVSASKDDEALDLPTIAQWAMIARDSHQLVDAIYAGIEKQTTIVVLSADAKVIEEAKKKSAQTRLSSTGSMPQPSTCDDTPTSAKESQ